MTKIKKRIRIPAKYQKVYWYGRSASICGDDDYYYIGNDYTTIKPNTYRNS